MRRPRLTDKRIRGLQLAIERLRPLAGNTAGDGLFRLPTDDTHDLRAAVAYVDALAGWNHERKEDREDSPEEQQEGSEAASERDQGSRAGGGAAAGD